MQKSKQTKKALFSSVIALILCFSMLLGTTFAWFTDSVKSGINKIQAGNLDVELEYWNGSSWNTVHGEDQLFTSNLWEPGHTEIVYLRLSNLGSLALKYQLGIHIVSETGSVSVETNEEFKLSQFIRYGVVENVDGSNKDTAFADRAEAIQALNGDSDPLEKSYAANGTMLAKAEPLYLALVVYMPESVGNEANHKTGEAAPTIELGVELVATQFTYEKDSFDELYDQGANASKVIDGIVYVYDGTDVILQDASAYTGETLVVPHGVTKIGSAAFSGHTTIKEVILPNSVKVIGTQAFQKSSLESIGLNEGLVEIQEKAFNQALNLASFSIPSTVETIGVNAFRMVAVNSLVVPANVTSLAEGAFRDLTQVKTIIIEGSPEIANFAFRSCPNLETVIIKGENTTFTGTSQVFSNNDHTNHGIVNVYVQNETVEQRLLDATANDASLNITVGSIATISNAEELIAMADLLNGTTAGFSRSAAPEVFLLTADIDMAGYDWTPIQKFTGIFDGLGHTISDLKISGVSKVAFFGEISGADIMNVSFDNVTVTGNHYVGVVFGWEGAESIFSNVSNVSVTNSSVIASTINNDDGDKVGGIGGYATTTVVDGCSVENTVVAAYRDAGGILGYANQSKGTNAAKIINNSVGNVTLLWDSSVNYKGFASVDAANLNPVVGQAGSKAVVENNTSDDSNMLKLEYDTNSGLYFNGKSNWGTYYIFNVSDLNKAAAYFAGVSHTSEANICTIELMADIDLADQIWNNWSVMWINFNGNGHTISNITTAEDWRTGFFGYAGAVKINDLTLENVTSTGAQAGTFAGSAEGLTTNNCFLKGENVVTYKEYVSESYTETWGGIGAVTGVLASSTVNVEITEGTTVALNKGTMTTNCDAIDSLTGYLEANKGTVVNNGTISVSASTAESIDQALMSGEDVVLSDDVQIDTTKTEANSGYGKTGVQVNGNVLDGNGNTLSVQNAWGTWDCAVNVKGGAVKNLTISSGMRGIFMGSASDDVYIDNVIIDGTVYTFNSDGGSKDYGVYISNSTLNGWTSFSDVHKEVVFTNCSFGEGSGYAFCRPYNNPSAFINCVFEEGFKFDTSQSSNITFTNCYYGDTLITAENAASLGNGDTTFFYNGVGNVVFN